MQRQIKRRKVVEAYEDEIMKKKPHVNMERMEKMEELDLADPKYSVSVMHYADKGNNTIEVIAYDIESGEEHGRLLMRSVEDLVTFMSGAYELFAESGGDKNIHVVCSF